MALSATTRASQLHSARNQAWVQQNVRQTRMLPQLHQTQPLDGASARKSQLMANRRSFGAEEKNEMFEETLAPKEMIRQLAGIVIRSQEQKQNDDTELKQAGQNADAQNLVKQQAKGVMMRGASFLANGIASALDLGTGGVALIIDVFVYAFSLGWLNVEMIYGRWIRKGKDPIISPISWAPIPMPIDQNANILQAIIIMADIAVVLGLLFALTISIFFMLLVFSLPLLITFIGAKSVFELLNLVL